jgi:hypothetical protein
MVERLSCARPCSVVTREARCEAESVKGEPTEAALSVSLSDSTWSADSNQTTQTRKEKASAYARTVREHDTRLFLVLPTL